MAQKPINQVLAENLAYFMKARGIATQPALAKKSGVAQRTISNYLRPEIRQSSKSGKPPSAKLTELEKIAEALEVGVWDLLRDMDPSERAFYAQIEEAYTKLAASRDAGVAPAAEAPSNVTAFKQPDRSGVQAGLVSSPIKKANPGPRRVDVNAVARKHAPKRKESPRGSDTNHRMEKPGNHRGPARGPGKGRKR